MNPPTPADRPLQREQDWASLQGAAGSIATPAASGPQLLDELTQFEVLTPARQLERIADQNILLLLQLQGFDVGTPEWQTLAEALIEYGYSVFMAWLVTGIARQMAARHGGGRGVLGLGKLPEGLRLSDDEAHALVVDLVVTSVDSFRTKTLMDPHRTWRATGGASLKTFFIGRALMELPDAYVRWRRSERPSGTVDLRDVDETLHVVDPEEQAVNSVHVEELLGDPEARAMFVLQQRGYSIAEISEMLTAAGRPATEASVWSRMNRVRHVAREGRRPA